MSVVPAARPDNLALFVKFFNNENGRDKFYKVIQYGARFLMWYCQQQDAKSEWAKRWKSLFIYMRDGRKLARFFKTAVEIQKIQVLLKQQPSLKQTAAVLSAAGLGMYWFFDNLVWLANSKFIDDKKKDQWNKLGAFGWWIGIVFAIVNDTISLQENFAKEEKLKKSLTVLRSSATVADQSVQDEIAKQQKELATVYNQRSTLYLNYPKNIGDLCPASNGWNLTSMVLGSNFNDGVVGIGGLVSGSIVCYNVYKGL